ncbi:MAG: hypothetical protein Q9O74_01820 [Planctomycetota bacterium]|nr:hypothetical protein [Planctomycetota bacterium]
MREAALARPRPNDYLVTHRDELSSEATEPITVRFGVTGAAAPSETSGESSLGLAA